MSGRLVHTGQVVVDLVMRVAALPAPGGDVLASDTAPLPGGGFNVMSAAARAGARVIYAGAHGTGRFGDQVRAALGDEGIAVAQRPVEGMDTGVCVVLVDDSAERTFITGAGAEAHLEPEQLEGVDVLHDDLVYVSGYSLLHGSNRAALLGWLPGLAVAATLFDPGPLVGQIPPDILAEVLSEVDILSCNAPEARTLTGLDDNAAAALVLAGRLGPDAVAVVRNGSSGCVLAHGGATRMVPGFPVTPVDTNGAGDTHCGVLAAAVLDGATIWTAVRSVSPDVCSMVSRKTGAWQGDGPGAGGRRSAGDPARATGRARLRGTPPLSGLPRGLGADGGPERDRHSSRCSWPWTSTRVRTRVRWRMWRHNRTREEALWLDTAGAEKFPGTASRRAALTI